MRRLLLAACAFAAVITPGLAFAHSVEPAWLRDGRVAIKLDGYIDFQYNTVHKKLDAIQVYYGCRPPHYHGQYPEFLNFTAAPHAALVGGKASGTFTSSNSLDAGTGTVTWSLSHTKLSSAGIAATLDLKVANSEKSLSSCDFTLHGRRLIPLLDIPGNS